MSDFKLPFDLQILSKEFGELFDEVVDKIACYLASYFTQKPCKEAEVRWVLEQG